MTKNLKEQPRKKNVYSTCGEGRKALDIYDLLREAHLSIRAIWKRYPELMHEAPQGAALNGHYDEWEAAIDAVDNVLYLAEGFFVQENQKLGDAIANASLLPEQRPLTAAEQSNLNHVYKKLRHATPPPSARNPRIEPADEM